MRSSTGRHGTAAEDKLGTKIIRSPKANNALYESDTVCSSCSTVANYVMSILVKDSIMDLSSDFRQLVGDYKRRMYGVRKDLPRWHTCVQLTDQAIPSAVGKIFVERYFDEGSKHEVGTTSIPVVLKPSYVVKRAQSCDRHKFFEVTMEMHLSQS